jgi:hypothetical protein
VGRVSENKHKKSKSKIKIKIKITAGTTFAVGRVSKKRIQNSK